MCIALSQKMQSLWWCGETLSETTLPLMIGDATTLSKLYVGMHDIDPAFRFPTQLTSLTCMAWGVSVDGALLTLLTRL